MIIDFRVRLPEQLRPDVAPPDSFASGYGRVLGMDQTYDKTLDDLREELQRADVGLAVVHAEYEAGAIAPALNEAVSQLVANDQVFEGFGTVPLDARTVRPMTTEVVRSHRLGLRGLNLQPAFFDRAIDDSELFPVYAAAEELGLIVAVHTGVHYSRDHRLDLEQPYRLDRVARTFPDLQLVACHAGWPWTAELCAVARRHPTVSLDVGAIRPRYIADPDTGWAPLRRLMDNVLRDQVLFATDWPAISPAQTVGEWQAVGLKSQTWQAFSGGNAARLLQL